MAEIDEELRQALAAVAPGTELRDGIERILRGRTGALIILGHDKVIETIATGGFPLDIGFSATRLRELAKMDGAVVVDKDVTRILRAATQLLPDASIETSESGTRHRTAERVSTQSGFPVVSVSQSMQIAALYLNGRRHVLENAATIISKGNQALQTLERYKNRLDEVMGTLSALEVEDLVTIRDVAAVLQRLEMVQRIRDEISGYVVELGTDGRLLSLQLAELTSDIDRDRDLVIRDYLSPSFDRSREDVIESLGSLSPTALLDLASGSAALGYSTAPETLDESVSPNGYRLLSKIPRLPGVIVDRLIEHFGGLQRLLAANLEELQRVDGVGEGRARAVRDGLSRLAESSILERYV
ncbi:DNA integrity scanning diadenylate cyclase DisA [Mobilicoccus pelagius]|uniref:DNA integrity scanning protein DisA n=1 Tax=Mobilicoccus pelagius NBRC 104925 TaxID=1089455 RepID=H5US50_9MICO|nr:DNA integrity scanning diadenylate cyclase DisA [Mobilicoccus pelagius]GAB48558.1 DNA integrity scanning protein DisA [Mobilicoccus pelagius NBRC 104925]